MHKMRRKLNILQLCQKLREMRKNVESVCKNCFNFGVDSKPQLENHLEQDRKHKRVYTLDEMELRAT